MPAVTWLLPVKNGMPFLRSTLEALSRQTYRDAIILAWDNGSTDDTVAELHRWIPSRLPGRIITDQPLPYPASLAALVELADTPLCARIDADDESEPHRLATQVAFLEQHPRVLLVGSQISPIDAAGQPVTFHYPLPVSYAEILHQLLETNCISHPTVMFRREAVLAVGNYRLPQPIEDYDLWLRVAARGEIHNLPDRLLRYRVHPGGVTHQALKAQTLADSLDAAWLRNAAAFCGLADPATAQRLRQRTSRVALPALWAIARTFQRRDGVAPLARFRRASFNRVCRHHLAPGDTITKAFLKACMLAGSRN